MTIQQIEAGRAGDLGQCSSGFERANVNALTNLNILETARASGALTKQDRRLLHSLGLLGRV